MGLVDTVMKKKTFIKEKLFTRMVSPLQDTSVHMEVDKRNQPNIKLEHARAKIQKEKT